MRPGPIILILSLLLAGCATATNSLSKADIAALRLERAEIRYKPSATISWAKAEQEYVDKFGKTPGKKRPKADDFSAAEVPGMAANYEFAAIAASKESKDYQRKKLTALITDYVTRRVMPRFQGTRAVHLRITVVAFIIPSAMQRVVLGGTPMLGAITELVDSKTGKTLGKMDRTAAAAAGQGIIGVAIDQVQADLADRVMNNYADQVLAWVLKQ